MRKAPVRAADNGNTEICGVARFRCRKHAGRIAPRRPRPLDWTDAAEPECRNAEGVRGCGRFGCSFRWVRPMRAEARPRRMRGKGAGASGIPRCPRSPRPAAAGGRTEKEE